MAILFAMPTWACTADELLFGNTSQGTCKAGRKAGRISSHTAQRLTLTPSQPSQRGHTPGRWDANWFRSDDLDLDQVLDAPVNFAALASVLKRIGKSKSLRDGERVHDYIITHGYASDTFLGNCLIQMYGDCGRPKEAQDVFEQIFCPNVYSWSILMKAYAQNGWLDNAKIVFDRMPERNVVSWSTIIAACAQHGHGIESLQFFEQMQLADVEPNMVTFICVVDACASIAALNKGRGIHAGVIEFGYERELIVGNALVNMYGKCKCVDDAKNVFGRMPHRNVISWSTMIAAFTQNGHFMEALELYHQMRGRNIKPDKVTLASIVNACTSLQDLQDIHRAVIESGCEGDVTLGTALINMYGKCGRLDAAKWVFERMLQQNVVSWSAMIGACAQNGHELEALKLFHRMQHRGFEPNNVTFICTLDACALLGDPREGQKIHACVVATRYEEDVMVDNALVNMYGNCGTLDASMSVFIRICHRNVISWSTMISACAQNGHGKEALELFYQMQVEDVKPDKITFISVIDACCSLRALEVGLEIHASIVDSGYDSDTTVANALLNTYCKCQSLDNARSIFQRMSKKDIVSWNTMLTLCSEIGDGKEALELFVQMNSEFIKSDEITFICVLNACINTAAVKEGQMVHALIIESGYEGSLAVGNALINMYGKCGNIVASERMFSRMPKLDVFSWNTMIGVYVQNMQGKKAVDVFYHMKLAGIKQDKITYSCILNVCSSSAAIGWGRKIHAAIVVDEFENDVVVVTALVSMYGKCRSLEDAKCVFDRMPSQNVMCWTAMISAYSQNGYGKQALELFQLMQEKGIRPDEITFICVLNVCSSMRWVEEGKRYFDSMKRDHGMTPMLEHCLCMIDILGHAGHLDEAENFISTIPYKNVPLAWLSLLSACRIHGDWERETRAATQYFTLVPKCADPFEMLSDVYGADRWADIAKVRETINCSMMSMQGEGTCIQARGAAREHVSDAALP